MVKAYKRKSESDNKIIEVRKGAYNDLAPAKEDYVNEDNVKDNSEIGVLCNQYNINLSNLNDTIGDLFSILTPVLNDLDEKTVCDREGDEVTSIRSPLGRRLASLNEELYLQTKRLRKIMNDLCI